MARRMLRKYDGYKGKWLKFGKRYALLILLLFLALRFLIGISWVSGDSMYPTLHNGETVIYLRTARSYEKGDIVSLRMAYGEYYIKRVVAVAGDSVDLHDGKLYINGEPDPWAHGTTEPQENMVSYPFVVPEGKIFVVGDNREVSIDSRTFGSIALSQTLGKIVFHIG